MTGSQPWAAGKLKNIYISQNYFQYTVEGESHPVVLQPGFDPARTKKSARDMKGSIEYTRPR